jgi:hypothetical protein
MQTLKIYSPSALFLRVARTLPVHHSGGNTKFREHDILEHSPYDDDDQYDQPIAHFFSINSFRALASLNPEMTLPSGITSVGALVIPNFPASLIVSSTAVVLHLGAGSGLFSKAVSRRASYFSQTMVFALSYAPACIFRGNILIWNEISFLSLTTFFIS